MTKAESMKAANDIIEELMCSEDESFVNRLVSSIVNGEKFTEEEIIEAMTAL